MEHIKIDKKELEKSISELYKDIEELHGKRLKKSIRKEMVDNCYKVIKFLYETIKKDFKVMYVENVPGTLENLLANKVNLDICEMDKIAIVMKNNITISKVKPIAKGLTFERLISRLILFKGYGRLESVDSIQFDLEFLTLEITGGNSLIS